MTNDERQKIYAALAAPFPESSIQRTDGRVTGRGYSTTGIGYQHVVDRLNQVLGVGGFRVRRKLSIKESVSSKGRPSFDVVCELELQLGQWVDGVFIPFAEVIGDGGHTATSLADATKGAFTNGFKKAAAFVGVGREAYAGTLDDDNIPPDEPIEFASTKNNREGRAAPRSTNDQSFEEASQSTPSSPTPASRSRLTSKQLAALHAISSRLHIGTPAFRLRVVDRFGCQPEFLTREQASRLIDEMSALPSPANGHNHKHDARSSGQER